SVSCRKSYTREDGGEDLRLDDVEEDLLSVDTARIPSFFMRNDVQTEGKAIDLQQATDLKTLIFGSSLCCFSEEWKIQSFTFTNTKTLKYGIVQRKGGPCGVLAAVQACVPEASSLREGVLTTAGFCSLRTRSGQAACIKPSLMSCGVPEMARRAVVTLSSGKAAVSLPAGRYRTDGILESLILYNFRRYEDLVTFLRQNINQFVSAPYGMYPADCLRHPLQKSGVVMYIRCILCGALLKKKSNSSVR
ncbi:unnamed protein product, partial [Ranitomeya imitator]